MSSIEVGEPRSTAGMRTRMQNVQDGNMPTTVPYRSAVGVEAEDRPIKTSGFGSDQVPYSWSAVICGCPDLDPYATAATPASAAATTVPVLWWQQHTMAQRLHHRVVAPQGYTNHECPLSMTPVADISQTGNSVRVRVRLQKCNFAGSSRIYEAAKHPDEHPAS
jgi:hypothetical protein